MPKLVYPFALLCIVAGISSIPFATVLKNTKKKPKIGVFWPLVIFAFCVDLVPPSAILQNLGWGIGGRAGEGGGGLGVGLWGGGVAGFGFGFGGRSESSQDSRQLCILAGHAMRNAHPRPSTDRPHWPLGKGSRLAHHAGHSKSAAQPHPRPLTNLTHLFPGCCRPSAANGHAPLATRGTPGAHTAPEPHTVQSWLHVRPTSSAITLPSTGLLNPPQAPISNPTTLTRTPKKPWRPRGDQWRQPYDNTHAMAQHSNQPVETHHHPQPRDHTNKMERHRASGHEDDVEWLDDSGGDPPPEPHRPKLGRACVRDAHALRAQGAPPKRGSRYPHLKGPHHKRGTLCPQLNGPHQKRSTPYLRLKGPRRRLGLPISNPMGNTEAWEFVSETQGAPLKPWSKYLHLMGPHRNVGVRIPNSRCHSTSGGVRIRNSRGHTKAWESVAPTLGATSKRGSL